MMGGTKIINIISKMLGKTSWPSHQLLAFSLFKKNNFVFIFLKLMFFYMFCFSKLISLFIFRLISFFSLILFRKTLLNGNYFLLFCIHLIFEDIFLIYL